MFFVPQLLHRILICFSCFFLFVMCCICYQMPDISQMTFITKPTQNISFAPNLLIFSDTFVHDIFKNKLVMYNFTEKI